jgi:spermidine/putrescine-binding protein
LAFSPDDFPEPPASWAELWAEDSGIQPLLPGNRHDAFGLVLLAIGLAGGFPGNGPLEKARHKLLDLAARGAFQPPAAAAALLAAGSNLLAVVASDCAARLTNGLAFTIPQEGTLLWIMSLAIPRDGRHLNEAHALIEYLLQPEVAAPAATAAAAATPNKGARDFLEFQVSENPLIYPESAQLARCRLNPAVDDDPQGLINQTWSAIRRAMLAGGERRLEGGP